MGRGNVRAAHYTFESGMPQARYSVFYGRLHRVRPDAAIIR
jgi:hypothetical protein